MSTAPLSYAETPEDQRIVQEYRDQQKMLLDSLVNRKQLLDPTLLAMAQGFLAPTKTGSFGEVLGNVASQIGPAQQAEEKRSQDIAKMRFDMAQQNYQMNRKDQATRMLFPGQPAGQAPAGGQGAPSAPMSPIAGAAGAPPAVPKPPQLSGYEHITPELALRLGSVDPELGKQAMQYIQAVDARKKLAQESVRTTEKGSFVVDPSQPGGGTFTPSPGGAYVERFLPGVGGVSLSPADVAKFDSAKDALSMDPSNARAREELNRLVMKSRGSMPSTTTGPQSPSEQALQAKVAEIKATKAVESESERTQKAINQGGDVVDRRAQYASLRSVVSQPNADQVWGIFSRPDISTALLNLVQEGIKSPGQTSIQVGALEDSLRFAKVPQELIDQYRFGLSTLANIQLQQAKLAAGQGSVSNFERGLYADATISPKDTPRTIISKLAMLDTRAEFDGKVASALRKSKMDVDDFKESPAYQNLVNDYLSKVTNIASSIGVKAPARSAPQSGTGKYGPAASKLREEVGIKR